MDWDLRKWPDVEKDKETEVGTEDIGKIDDKDMMNDDVEV